jgi:proteic killer suppression protein
MIKSFKDKDTERVFEGVYVRTISRDLQRLARRRLIYLNSAKELADLTNNPGNRLEKLKGSREGQYSIRINDQYRICFEWQDGDAYDVEMVDYH